MKKNRIIRRLVNICLGLTVALSVGFGTLPTSAHAAASTTSTSHSMINISKRFLGVPYHLGATSGNTRAFDCSSFTQYVYKRIGISLPRTSHEQSHVGKYVPRNQLRPGDLVFFYRPVHHVGIYIGNGKIIHTYGHPGVTISNLKSGWWSAHYAFARRVL